MTKVCHIYGNKCRKIFNKIRAITIEKKKHNAENLILEREYFSANKPNLCRNMFYAYVVLFGLKSLHNCLVYLFHDRWSVL